MKSLAPFTLVIMLLGSAVLLIGIAAVVLTRHL